MDAALAQAAPAAAERASGRARLGTAAWLLLLYMVVTRIGHLEAAKLGGQIGSLPVFLTEIFLLLTAAALVVTRAVPLLVWAIGGGQTSPVGRAVWVIAILACIHFALSFSRYGVYAARDFAIFMYSLFFVLAWLALPRAADAVWILRGSIYAGVVTAILLIVFSTTGVGFGLFDEADRYVLDTFVVSRGSGDAGGIIAFSLAGLAAYIVLQRRHRFIHITCALICFAGVMLPQTRSAVFGLAVAGAFSALALGVRHRLALGAIVLALTGLVIAAPALPAGFPGAGTLQNFYYAVASGAQFDADGNAQFRLVRWNLAFQTWLDNPVFGVGFGTDILPSWLLSLEELNTFNYGLPHNTYLTIMARTGLVGLVLFLFPILWTLRRIYRLMRARMGDADLLAVGNVICCMAGFGLFVLFFERPLHGASFWIMVAVAVRLIQSAEWREPAAGARGA